MAHAANVTKHSLWSSWGGKKIVNRIVVSTFQSYNTAWSRRFTGTRWNRRLPWYCKRSLATVCIDLEKSMIQHLYWPIIQITQRMNKVTKQYANEKLNKFVLKDCSFFFSKDMVWIAEGITVILAQNALNQQHCNFLGDVVQTFSHLHLITRAEA